MRTPNKLTAATATIGPIIHGIGARSHEKRNPAGIPTASAFSIPGTWARKLENSFIDSDGLAVAVT